MSGAEIKPCPWCGGAAQVDNAEGTGWWWVECCGSDPSPDDPAEVHCGDQCGPFASTRESAIAAWNAAPRPDALAAEADKRVAVQMLLAIDAVTLQAALSQPPDTDERNAYRDGFSSGVIYAHRLVREKIESLIPGFHEQVAALAEEPRHVG